MSALEPGPEARKEFLLLYYQVLHSKNDNALVRRGGFIKLGLAGTFGYYAATFSNELGLVGSPYRNILLWMPLAFNCLGLLMDFGVAGACVRRGKIMGVIEAEFGVEHWQVSQSTLRNEFQRRPFTVTSIAVWALLIVTSMIVPLLVINGNF